MADLFYRIIKLAGKPFRFKITGLENISPGCPKVFISNHSGSLGPIAIYISLPVRLRPWVIAEMTDPIRTADYLYRDFIKPAWHLNGKLGRMASRLLAPLAVRVVCSFHPIAVDRNRGWCREAFLQSRNLLLSGESLLIFPEQPEVDEKHPEDIRPFLGGFCWLSHMVQKATGQPLIFQPMAVCPENQRIALGAPLTIDLTNDYRGAIDLATRRFQSIVTILYESLQRDSERNDKSQ